MSPLRGPRATPVPTPHPRTLVAVLGFACILVALMPTIVVPLQTELPGLLDTSPSTASWALTSTLLVAAVATPITGRLGDRFGKRRMLVVCHGMLVAGSVLVAVSSQVGIVVAGRSLQGAAASILPLSVAIAHEWLPPDRTPGAIALISGSLGIGSSLGLPISAAVVEHVDWHLVFAGTAVFGVLSLVGVLFVVPESPAGVRRGRFDVGGAVLLAVGLVLVLLYVTKGSTWGWASLLQLALLLGGVAVLGGWVLLERRVRDPLFDLEVITAPAMLYTNLASVLAGFAMVTTTLVLFLVLATPVAAGVGLGQTLLLAALFQAPAGIAQIMAAPLTGRFVRRFGGRAALLTGLATLGTGFVLALLTLRSVWGLFAVSILNGLGIGLSFASMGVLVLGAVPASQTAAANGLNTLSRALGSAFASAVVAAVVSGLAVTVDGVPVPGPEAFLLGLGLGLASAVAGIALALGIPRTRRTDPVPAALPGPPTIARSCG